jgi:acyl-coenzyme A synthetase/AMP-(fatty) acid ligase
MTQNVAEIVTIQAQRRPASPAIITHDAIITYGQLKVAVGVVARHLREQGVIVGQVVGVSMGQNPLHVITLLALAQIGAVSLPLHVAVPAERRALAARRFGASCVVSGREDMALSGLSFSSLAGLKFDGVSVTPDYETQEVDDDTPMRVVISSGTSGDPKGMLLTHGLMKLRMAQADPQHSCMSRTLPMDLNFIVGFRPAFSALADGGTLVMPQSMLSDHLLQALVSHAVTHTYLSPSQAHGIVDMLAAGSPHCPGLVCLRIGGGPLSPALLQEVREKITPNVYVSYGSTETGLLTYATPDILDRHPSSVGKPCAWAEIQVVDDHDRPIAAETIGVVRIRSTHQVAGYYQDAARSQRDFRGGWFYPGDLGGFDEEGLLYIEGRADDLLNVGGLKVNPEEIENNLLAQPGVTEAGAFVLAGAEGSEQLAAAIVLQADGQLAEVEKQVRTKLGPLAPTRYFVVTTLPRTLTGKLRRSELTAQFSRNLSEE